MASVKIHVSTYIHMCVYVRDASASVRANNQLLNHPGGANGIHKPHFSATTAVHKHKTNKNVNKGEHTDECRVLL